MLKARQDRLEPLNAAEQATAEMYHDYITSVLHMLKCSVDEFYDIAAIGYLRAVQAYHRTPGLKDKCALFTVCKYRIHREIGHYFHAQNAAKRKPKEPTISLDAIIEGNNDDYYNCIEGGQSCEDIAVEDEDFAEILATMTAQQQRIAMMKMEGYNHTEIKGELKIGQTALKKELDSIKDILRGAAI